MVVPGSEFSWAPVVGANGYEIIAVDANGNANEPFNSPVLSGTVVHGVPSIEAYLVMGDLPAGPYRIQVRAVALDPANNSLYSDILNIDWDPALPTPAGLSVA
jgi:hypothetical protein